MGILRGSRSPSRNTAEPNRSGEISRAGACTYKSYKDGTSAYGLWRRTKFGIEAARPLANLVSRLLAAGRAVVLGDSTASSERASHSVEVATRARSGPPWTRLSGAAFPAPAKSWKSRALETV